jgi:hypothetical protein
LEEPPERSAIERRPLEKPRPRYAGVLSRALRLREDRELDGFFMSGWL